MSIFISIILLLLFLGLAVFLYVQYNIQLKKASGVKPDLGRTIVRPSPKARASSSNTQWKAVKVKTGLMCCKQSEKMRGQVFLTADAPTFPLKGCKVNGCECKYVHMEDRREGDDRREATEYRNELYRIQENDRRKIKDRRSENL